MKVKISEELLKEIDKRLEKIENSLKKEEKTVKVSMADFFEHLKKCPHCKEEARKIIEEKTEQKAEQKTEHVVETRAKFY